MKQKAIVLENRKITTFKRGSWYPYRWLWWSLISKTNCYNLMWGLKGSFLLEIHQIKK